MERASEIGTMIDQTRGIAAVQNGAAVTEARLGLEVVARNDPQPGRLHAIAVPVMTTGIAVLPSPWSCS